MDDYVAKPLRPDEVDEMLARWLPGAMRPSTAMAAKTHGVDPIDAERFDDLARDFSPEVVREIVNAFIDSTPPIIERIVLAAEGADHTEIAQGAHRLKGGCLAVGAGQLNDIADELETLGREHAPGEALQASGGAPGAVLDARRGVRCAPGWGKKAAHAFRTGTHRPLRGHRWGGGP